MYHGLRPLAILAVALALGGCATTSATDRAMALTRQHRESEAVSVLQKHLAEHPNDIAARRLLVRVLAFTGDLGAARREVDELVRRSPNGDPTPYIELGHAYELVHQFEDALASYDQAAQIAPSSPAGPREGGMRCARWGEVEESRPRLEEAIRRGARDAETYHTLGLVLVHLRELDAAAEAYRAGLAADPQAVENILGLATVAILKDDAAGALAAYDRLLAQRPRYAAAELGRSWALAKLGRTAEASRALDHAEELGAPAANVARQRAALTKPRATSEPEPNP